MIFFVAGYTLILVFIVDVISDTNYSLTHYQVLNLLSLAPRYYFNNFAFFCVLFTTLTQKLGCLSLN